MTVVLTGDGPARAAALFPFEETSSALPADSPSIAALLGAGVCGSLTPGLSAGEILVSSRLVDDAGDAPPPCAEFVACAVALGATPAAFVTVARPLVSSSEKRRAAERSGAGGSLGSAASPGAAVAAVDMESAGWARAAARRGVPFVILRAVADTFEESLPAFLAECVGPSGSIDWARVARGAALGPWSLPRLLAMRARVRSSAARLAAFLARFLEGGVVRG